MRVLTRVGGSQSCSNGNYRKRALVSSQSAQLIMVCIRRLLESVTTVHCDEAGQAGQAAIRTERPAVIDGFRTATRRPRISHTVVRTRKQSPSDEVTMPSESFTAYLTTEVLSEQRTISYRILARALKVHINAAKCMLYEFYETENTRKAGSVYATYLLAGTKKHVPAPEAKQLNGTHAEDEDEPMPPSSPPPFTSSMLEPSSPPSQKQPSQSEVDVPVKTVTLVREEQLEAVQEQYDTVTSIHIYSVSPYRIEDLVTLTDTSRALYTDYFAKEDPLIHNKAYGVILNPQVRRRKGKRPVIPESTPAPMVPAKQAIKVETKPTATNNASATTTTEATEPKRPGSSGSPTSAAKPPILKRDASDFFKKAFGGSSTPKPAQPKPTTTTTTTNTTVEFEPDSDEAESDSSALFLDTGKRRTSRKRSSTEAAEAKKEREDKASKLRKMMDSDDDEELAAEPSVPKGSSGVKEDTTMEDAEDEDDGDEKAAEWSDSDEGKPNGSDDSHLSKAEDKAPPRPGPEPEQDVQQTKGRRRGKRKVMKKRTMKDEDGFLVTKEEAVWESFSESEPEAAPKPKAKMPAFSQAKGKPAASGSVGRADGAAAAKAKAKGGKPDIKSFFGKR